MDAVDFTTQRWRYEDDVRRLEFLQVLVCAGCLEFDRPGMTRFSEAFHQAVVEQYLMASLMYPDDAEATRLWHAFKYFEGLSTVGAVVRKLTPKEREQIRVWVQDGNYERYARSWEARDGSAK